MKARTSYDCPKCGKPGGLKANGVTPGGKKRWKCNTAMREQRPHGQGAKFLHCYGTTNPEAPYRGQDGTTKDPDKNPKFKRPLGGIKRFVITSAQNSTPIHEGFWQALLAYCDANDAELVVIPLRYKNPTSRWSASQANEEFWHVPDKYLYNQRKKLNENLVLLADVKTQPTATNPLSGFEGMTHGESGILGHTKLQLKTVAAPQDRYPKIMTTTGACTVPNYTDTKAGKLGEFHHTLGATVVDIVGKKFFLYQVNANKDGSFTHLDKDYHADGSVTTALPAKAVIFGDTHRVFQDPKVEEVSFSPGGIVDVLDPKALVFHDIGDGYAINHHDSRDPFRQVHKRVSDMHLIEKEVRDDVAWLRKQCKTRQGIVVPSNHDDFLARWLRDADWRMDPDNAEFYLETALALVQQIKAGEEIPDAFRYWVDRLKGKAKIKALKRNESYMAGGIELGLHGDKGPNGSRGTRNSFRRIGVKTFIGHSHSPGIEEGCYQVGTSSSLQLSYNLGPSSWMHCHGVVYASGKRSLLFIVDGSWKFE